MAVSDPEFPKRLGRNRPDLASPILRRRAGKETGPI